MLASRPDAASVLPVFAVQHPPPALQQDIGHPAAASVPVRHMNMVLTALTHCTGSKISVNAQTRIDVCRALQHRLSGR